MIWLLAQGFGGRRDRRDPDRPRDARTNRRKSKIAPEDSINFCVLIEYLSVWLPANDDLSLVTEQVIEISF
jgi:hypothetical protein